ncbi:hypothetical protein AD931_03665 [Gluconobacter oxydans]|uniref:TIGR02302 family protein n=2 Tax=Gluconobacter oxydans TaxID=442 RepID=A0AB34XJT7_GLUOY|nr:DUF4175 family protein [Gluconobacter oxydans]AHK71929.1 DUF4175 family protein [Gluconobacter oxydans DSM 3504]KXV09254.1 hypothetical protein AD931_03665 [Gluconobacter oxydans]
MAEPNPALHLKALRRKAQRVLWWERAWEPLRWPLLLVAFYVLACLARIPQSLPDWLHILLEVGVLGTALWLTITGLRRVPPVSIPVADRRIEHDSKLAYQPLLSLTDRPAFAGNGEQSAIWSRHVERVTASLGTLRVGLPHPETSLHERLALIAVPLAIVVAAVLGGTHTPSRLHAGMIPGVDDDSIPLPTLQAWIDRPSYAPGAPIFLSATGRNTLDVPQGAILNATITGAHGKPALHGIASAEQNRLDAESWNSHGTLQQSGTISIIVRGRTLGSWRVKVEPDLPPTVTWDGKPGPQKDDWRTGLPWHVHQTYGVASLEAEINLPGLTRGRILRVPIPLDGQPKDAKGVATPDLSSDPFAGMEVEGRLHARSASGRESRSDIVKFQIAARKFTDPLARALVALRRRLMLGQQRASQAAAELNLLTQTTDERAILATLGLEIASLQKDAPDGSADRVPGELWALALYLDDLRRDGPDIADAAAEVRAAQQGVQQQLDHMRDLGDKGHTLPEQEELQRRTQALKDALNRRMQLLFSRAAQSGIVMPQSGTSSADPFSDEMRRLQSEANQGHGDEALKRLQQMEDMAERMRQASPEDLKALAEQMKAQAEARAQRAALHDLVHRETTLLDHTQSRLSAAQKAAAPPDDGSHPDVSQMSTADLLRQLGMQPPPGMDQPTDAKPPAPVDPATVAAQSDGRRADHALQRALQRVNDILSHRVKDLTGKPATAFDKAKTDMQTAREALADRKDAEAQTAEQKVLADLSEAGKQMRQNQKSGGSGKGQGGSLSFIPSGGAGGSGKPQHGAKGQQGDDGDQPQAGDEDGDDDDQKDQDPLGRKLGEGDKGKDSDAHIPDKSARDRARDIERELRRRASDRTRPQSELDYLERLLKSF